MNTSQLIAGILGIIMGFCLIFVPLIITSRFSVATLIYGIPILIISIFILLNKGEDKIEEIKKTKSTRRKK